MVHVDRLRKSRKGGCVSSESEPNLITFSRKVPNGDVRPDSWKISCACSTVHLRHEGFAYGPYQRRASFAVVTSGTVSLYDWPCLSHHVTISASDRKSSTREQCWGTLFQAFRGRMEKCLTMSSASRGTPSSTLRITGSDSPPRRVWMGTLPPASCAGPSAPDARRPPNASATQQLQARQSRCTITAVRFQKC
jgi:hypothetical protein